MLSNDFSEDEITSELPLYVERVEHLSARADAASNKTGYCVVVIADTEMLICRAPCQIPRDSRVIDGPVGDGVRADAIIHAINESRGSVIVEELSR